jgi:hypothetical protein
MKLKLMISLLLATSFYGKAQTVFTNVDSMYINDSVFTVILDSSGLYVNVPSTPIPTPQSIGDTSKARSVYLAEMCDMISYGQPIYKVSGQNISFRIDNSIDNSYSAWHKYGNKFLFWYLTYIYNKYYGIEVNIN